MPVKRMPVLLFLMILVTSCGYRFAGVGQLPGNTHSIHVSVLDNPTGETGIESILSNDIIHEFTRNGNPVCSNKAEADSILNGRISGLNIQNVAHKGTHSSLARKVTLTVDLTLKDTHGDILWIIKGLSASQTYDVVVDDKSATEQNRRLAIESLSKRLAETTYNHLAASF